MVSVRDRLYVLRERDVCVERLIFRSEIEVLTMIV